MAQVKKNIITRGLSGTLGHSLVFRNVGDRTIVASSPSKPRIQSEAQVEHHKRFQEATLYAKSQMADAESKAEYAEKALKKQMGSAYTVAVADYFYAPDISNVDLTGYSGNINDIIRISVTDDFKVARVQVEIYKADGTLVESGDAVFQEGALWVYTCSMANEDLNGNKITVRAFDKPGNVTENQSVL